LNDSLLQVKFPGAPPLMPHFLISGCRVNHPASYQGLTLVHLLAQRKR